MQAKISNGSVSNQIIRPFLLALSELVKPVWDTTRSFYNNDAAHSSKVATREPLHARPGCRLCLTFVLMGSFSI
eukprot:6172256-Pleurochrysis_carterae.AAC.2